MMIKVDVDKKNIFNEFKKTKYLLLNFNHIYNSLWIFYKNGKIVNIEKAKEIVISAVKDALEVKIEVTENMKLIGGESSLDSMKLVQVCLALEDIADAQGFEFDWTSEVAMSKSRSMFRNIKALAEEFASQSRK